MFHLFVCGPELAAGMDLGMAGHVSRGGRIFICMSGPYCVVFRQHQVWQECHSGIRLCDADVVL